MIDQHAHYLKLLKIPLWHSRTGCDPAYEIEVTEHVDERMPISLPPLPEIPSSVMPIEAMPDIAPIVAAPVVEPIVLPVAQSMAISTEPTVIDLLHRSVDAPKIELVHCQACQLSKARTQVVQGVGNARAKLMIITEAPTLQEDIAGQPLAGRAGQLFDEMLKSIGLSRDEVFMTPYVKCAPLQSLISVEEEQQCYSHLQAELKAHAPEKILILGRHAARAVLNIAAPFDELRMNRFNWMMDGQAIPVQVSYNPYQLLKFPEDKRKAWQDMKRLIG